MEQSVGVWFEVEVLGGELRAGRTSTRCVIRDPAAPAGAPRVPDHARVLQQLVTADIVVHYVVFMTSSPTTSPSRSALVDDVPVHVPEEGAEVIGLLEP